MDNRDLLRQYVDLGQQISKHQYIKLDDNLKGTYLRKRLIATNQDLSNSYEDIKNYEYFGAPDSWKPVLVSHLLKLMDEYFSEVEYGNSDDPDFNFKYGSINPILVSLLKLGWSSPESDMYILELLKNDRFHKSLNKNTIGRILNRANDVGVIFNALGDKGNEYTNRYVNNDKKVESDIAYSNHPLGYSKLYGAEKWVNHFRSLPLRDLAYMIMHSPNPLEFLELAGDACMELYRGDDNFLIHALNNSSHPKIFQELLQKYNIDFSHIKHYNNFA